MRASVLVCVHLRDGACTCVYVCKGIRRSQSSTLNHRTQKQLTSTATLKPYMLKVARSLSGIVHHMGILRQVGGVHGMHIARKVMAPVIYRDLTIYIKRPYCINIGIAAL